MTRKKKFPFVFMVVLNWNGLEHLKYCIPSLLKTDYPNYHILFVDNASKDGSVEFVRKNYPEMEILANPQNLGWSGGNNTGIIKGIKAKADYIILLNNDILIDPPWIKFAVETCESDKEIGMLGFEVYGAGEKVPVKEFEEARKKFKKLIVKNTKSIRGLALFVKREVFENIGLIDEVYFAYGEENDIEFRAGLAGYRLVEINVPLWHYCEGSWGKRRWKASYLAIRNTMRLAIKNYNLFDIIKIIGFVWFISSFPFKKIDREDVHRRRLRPSWSFINFWLFLYCLIWNIIHLPETLILRNKDLKKVRKTRKKLKLKDYNILK